ncbi:MAG: hypothetical protein FRX49_02494 [Trebouxia sp. A1-2]|nr:MAG: hypothetical protein FRX49_02494 [Trebouxia sp. A1-2]
MSLITAGAPLRNSRAEPLGPSSDHTTTPDLRVWEVKSITFAMESLASRALERALLDGLELPFVNRQHTSQLSLQHNVPQSEGHMPLRHPMRCKGSFWVTRKDVMWCLLEGRCSGKVWDVDKDLHNECKGIQMKDILQHMQSDLNVLGGTKWLEQSVPDNHDQHFLLWVLCIPDLQFTPAPDILAGNGNRPFRRMHTTDLVLIKECAASNKVFRKVLSARNTLVTPWNAAANAGALQQDHVTQRLARLQHQHIARQQPVGGDGPHPPIPHQGGQPALIHQGLDFLALAAEGVYEQHG